MVGGRCFAFLLVGGRFLFLRMVGGRCLNQYMVGGRWLMVGGLWSVAGRWAVVLYYALARLQMELCRAANAKIKIQHFGASLKFLVCN